MSTEIDTAAQRVWRLEVFSSSRRRWAPTINTKRMNGPTQDFTLEEAMAVLTWARKRHRSTSYRLRNWLTGAIVL